MAKEVKAAANETCVFCQIAKGKSPCHKIWESTTHMAFLSIFPNTEGFTVVIPKKHHSGYTFDLEDQILCDLILASRQVTKLLDGFFPDVNRTAMMFEGFGIGHIHTKLFPMHEPETVKEFRAINSFVNKYYPKYQGYVSSHNYKREDDDKLAALAKEIKEFSQREKNRKS